MNNDQLKILFFDDADVLFQIYDKDLNLIEANKATFQLLNTEPANIVGKNIRDLSPDVVTSGRYDAYLNVIKTGKTHIIDELKTWSNNQEMYFRIKAFKIGEGLGIATKNITDLENIIKKTVRELEVKVKNLDEANKNITEMMKILTSQNHQLNDFCSIVSHNLRAPLINLSILSDFITDCDNLEEREVMINKISPVIATLNETFNNLVESLQIREEVGLSYEINSFEEITKKILQKHSIEIELYNAEIEFDFNSASHIHYPKKYLDSILSNLISNALKYRSYSRNAFIQIKTEIKEDKICLKVADNGLGIDLKKNGDNMFKMRKVFHDRPDAKGYGLFLTKTQVESMEGKIFVESIPDQGSIFSVEFNIKNNIV